MRLTLLLCVVSFSAVAGSGVTVTFERDSGGPKSNVVLITDGERLRINAADAKMEGLLWDGSTKQLVMLNADKTYLKLDEAKMKATREKMDAVREMATKQMEAQLAKAPPERRAAMEQQLALLKNSMQGMAPPAPQGELKFTAKGQKRTVGTWSCEAYGVQRGDGEPWEVCVVAWDKAPLKQEDFKAATSMTEFFMSMTGSPKGQPLSEEMFGKELKSYPGFPVQTLRTVFGKPHTMSLVSVKRGSVDAASFAVPTGYTEKAMPEMGGPMGPPMGPPMGQPPPRTP